MKKKRNIVEWAMHYRQIVILLTCVLVAFGIFGLENIKKNEFPDFTVRQGVVMAVYPGASASEVEEQVTKSLEDYIFTYKDVCKAKTKSYSQNGVAIIQVELNDDIKDKDAFWSKFKHGIESFKSSLPRGVVAVQVNDDFGDTSALLITMESNDKTYRELNEYMDMLKDSLRTVEEVGRLNVVGMQKEQISVYLDSRSLNHYGLNEMQIAQVLQNKGMITSAGTLKENGYDSPIMVSRSLNQVRDVEQTIVYSDPAGNVIRLKDVAEVEREYPEPTSYVTNNGHKCLVISVEQKSGRNIVDMGKKVSGIINNFHKILPKDVTLFKITDQAQVVESSIVDFIRELVIAIVAVVLVVLLLMPMRVALVAASTIPITIFIALGLFYALGIELNTVTLSALIMTLGMIVDNSIVIIDNYVELIRQGTSRWKASIQSATHFFKSIFTATMAISVTFFPFLIVLSSTYVDFLYYFPWAISIVLFVSLVVATLIVPFMQFTIISKPISIPKDKFSPMNFLQKWYDRLIDVCFRHPSVTISVGVGSIVFGIVILGTQPIEMMPRADRNQFAVEIFMPTGTSLSRTAEVADSLERILRKDERIVSIASFKGTSSPRFQTTYAPQLGGPNFAQFIVNTKSPQATVDVLQKYRPLYQNAVPEAVIRFKQLSYNESENPVEIRLSGSDWNQLKQCADTLTKVMRNNPDLELVRNDLHEPITVTKVNLNEMQSDRLGISNSAVEMMMATDHNTDGYTVGTVWNGDYDINVNLKGINAKSTTREQLGDELIQLSDQRATIPIRQVSTITPEWQDAQISHRNGMRTITVMSEVKLGKNVIDVSTKLQKQLAKISLPYGVKMAWGGEMEGNNDDLPRMEMSLIAAVVIIFFLLIFHFKNIRLATLLLVSQLLCILGTAMGILISGTALSMTCFLGIISLMGILVRNAIIMYDYAEELRKEEKFRVRDAILLSAKRRMRPIFLTSVAASMGVLPMVLSGSQQWAPMGNVIFWGTLITMFFILTVLPVAYWLLERGSSRKKDKTRGLINELKI